MVDQKLYKVSSILLISILIGSAAGSSFADSPRKQLAKNVLPEDVVCKEGRVLAVVSGKTPLCIKPATAEQLKKRWGANIVISEQAAQKVVPKTSPADTKGSAIKSQAAKTQPKIESVPAAGGSTVNFYITDDDLNTSPNGIDVIDTAGLLEFTINGIKIEGPETMTETGVNTGRFYVKLVLPDTINGRPLTQDDVMVVRYFDQSDAAGQSRTVSSSLALSRTQAQIEKSGGQRIGRDFTVSIYEPDANLNSREVDKIPLSRIEFRAEGGIRTTLANSAFDANSSHLLETGENTGVFLVVIKIPRTIEGKTIHIGDWYELRYIDPSTPSGTSEKVILKGRIG
ncbi:MAG TPA: hypothetical protein VNK44_05800 [Candidatus Nitrosotenuis sp.]|nr:hypothetical protein [Candidatus Nitrosotenuis sp.]